MLRILGLTLLLFSVMSFFPGLIQLINSCPDLITYFAKHKVIGVLFILLYATTFFCAFITGLALVEMKTNVKGI